MTPPVSRHPVKAMTDTIAYPIGIPGTPWGEAERSQWRATQSRRRRYDLDVTTRVDRLADRFEKVVYGQVDYDGEAFTLHALRSLGWSSALPTALVTGGVHGYETSGVAGALEFLETRAADYAGKVNLLVAPCVSPWSYERNDIVETYELALADSSFTVAAGTIEAGRVAGQHWKWTGVKDGRERVVHETVWRMHHSVAPDWAQGANSVVIEGEPTMRVELGETWLTDPLGATAWHAVNAIRAVCDAKPGIRTFLDLPLILGHNTMRCGQSV